MSDTTTNQPAPQAVADDAIEVEFENGTKETVTVPRMKLGCYEACYAAKASGKEFRFLELALNKPAGWCILLVPPSYSALISAVLRRNQDFFTYMALRQTTGDGMRETMSSVASRGQIMSRA